MNLYVLWSILLFIFYLRFFCNNRSRISFTGILLRSSYCRFLILFFLLFHFIVYDIEIVPLRILLLLIGNFHLLLSQLLYRIQCYLIHRILHHVFHSWIDLGLFACCCFSWFNYSSFPWSNLINLFLNFSQLVLDNLNLLKHPLFKLNLLISDQLLHIVNFIPDLSRYLINHFQHIVLLIVSILIISFGNGISEF